MKTIIKAFRDSNVLDAAEVIYEETRKVTVHTSSVKINGIYVCGDEVVILLDKRPARIDYDSYGEALYILTEKDIETCPEPYKLTVNAESVTVWSAIKKIELEPVNV